MTPVPPGYVRLDRARIVRVAAIINVMVDPASPERVRISLNTGPVFDFLPEAHETAEACIARVREVIQDADAVAETATAAQAEGSRS
ncbi:MAG: hypothetical protein ACE37J_11840 [Pikeienuella sp.]|uniref:hypothetical protein n=1 Tax=Pikeienuella sp. TaxID=2831957 RepID=UPI00391C801B